MQRTRRSNPLVIMLIGLAATGIAQAQTLTAPPPPPKPEIYRDRLMVNTGSGQCVVPDVNAPATPSKKDRYRRRQQPPVTGPAKPGLVACSFEQPQQQLWQWVGVGQDKKTGIWDTFVMQTVSKRACLGVENRSTQEGAALALVNCELSDPSQMWIRLTNSSDTSRPAPATGWINVNSGKCITAWKGQDKQTTLRQFTCQYKPGFGPQEFYGIVF